MARRRRVTRPAPRLRLRDGVAGRLLWSSSPASLICSSCGSTIDERETPLRFTGKGHEPYAVFCDECAESCFVRS